MVLFEVSTHSARLWIFVVTIIIVFVFVVSILTRKISYLADFIRSSLRFFFDARK